MMKHIPNLLTLVRFILVPFILVLVFQERYLEAFIILTTSGITDVLDGYIARKYNFITDFGKLMDPLADKVTQISILIALSLKHIIPFWMLVIVFLKEVIMIAGASFLYGKELVVSSKWYGKLATVIFYIAITCSLIINYFHLDWHFDMYIYYIALATTVFSLIMYFEAFYRQGYLKKENLKITKQEENIKKE
ncbi:MAG: CDP-diacylglycerol--glycerol-3-phosphate 3-phosphatidyltransferase [Clostridia bacterium]